jgi:hypothetical protein
MNPPRRKRESFVHGLPMPAERLKDDAPPSRSAEV